MPSSKILINFNITIADKVLILSFSNYKPWAATAV